MKTLLILRHAHSLESQRGYNDKDRQLSKEGINEAIKIGSFIKHQGILVDKIISSTANRALTTATLVANAIAYDSNNISKEDNLYNASIKTILDCIISMADDFSTIIIVGHNPHLSYFAEYVSKEIIEPFETAGMAIISFNIKSWGELTKKSGALLLVTSPSLLD